MKKTIKAILILIMIMVVCMTVIACDKPNLEDEELPEEAEELTRTQIITNGTFYSVANVTGSKRYIKENVTNWEVGTGSLSKASDGVIYGALDLSKKERFEAERKTFNPNETLAYPGIDPQTPKEKDDPEKLQDTNALILASTKTAGSIFYKNTSNFKLEANKYYRLQFSVLTDIDFTDVPQAERADKGAWVIIDGGIYKEFPRINTNGEWQKYEVYIEGSDYDSTRELKIRLWLGHGPEKIKSETNVHLTKGTALFDNIICVEIEKSAYQAVQESDKVKKATMIFPDMEFVQQNELSVTSSPDYFYSFRSGTNSSNNAVNYTLTEGKTGLTANKPSVDRPFVGIVDLSKLYRYDSTKEGEAKYINTYKTDHSKSTFHAPKRSDFMSDEGVFRLIGQREETLNEYKALMIYHDDLSGAGFVSTKQLLIKKNTFYTIKVWAYVWTIDFPTPPTSEVGAQPKEPGNEDDRPTQESVDAAKEAMLIAEAEYNYKRLHLGQITEDNLTTEQKDKIAELSEDRKAAIEGEDIALNELKTAYDDLKEDYEEQKELFDKWEEYDEDYAEYQEKYDNYMQKYNQWLAANSIITEEEEEPRPYAQFKITGAGDLEPVKTTEVGKWELLEFHINGNQLSDRKVNLEFWFGEGTNVDYTTLMIGGVFFDNISIEASPTPKAGVDYQELSPFSQKDIEENNVDMGGLFEQLGEIKYSGDQSLTEDDLWEKELAKGASEADKAFIEYEIVADQTYPIKIDGQTKYYNLLKMRNTDYTAGIINYRGQKEILANKCYRLSFWAWTEGINKGLGAKLELMGKEKDSANDMSSLSSFTDFNNENAQEMVFYIRGDTLKNNVVGLKFTLGEGTRFDTAKYIKGTLYVSAITIKEIDYDEYNATSKSGDQTKSYAFSNTSSTGSDSVTNGNFGSINLADIEKDAINDKGELVGVAPTSSWTIPSSSSVTTNSYNKPTITIPAGEKYLEWKHVVDADGERPEGYEVYINNTKKPSEEEEGEEEDVGTLYIGYVASDQYHEEKGEGDSKEYIYRFNIPAKAAGNFTVRAVSQNGVGNMSDSFRYGGDPDNNELDDYFEEYTEVPKREYKIGTINYKTYGKEDGEEKGIYADEMFKDSTYISPFQTLLMITSNYGIKAGVTAASKSLNANSYYEISVWVKTIEGAKASISFKDISDVLETRDEYVGYVNQDTQGKWVQYRFYIATDAVSSSVQLMLSMGNPYGQGRAGSEDEKTKVYDNSVLSKGAVFFDNVKVTTLDKEEFEEKCARKAEDGKDGEYYIGNEVFHVYEMVYANMFAYKVLSYATDSFDSYTENTVTEEFDTDGEYNEGFYRGHQPGAYKWSRATDGSTTDFERLYGVYSYQDIKSNDHPLLTNDKNSDPFSAFMPDGFDLSAFIKISGYNSLVMSNLIENGQKFTLSDSRTIESGAYYKLSFKAKTLLAQGDYAEFRYMYEGNSDEYTVVKINTSGAAIDQYTEYEFYIYNKDDTSKNIKWEFGLGGDGDDEKIKGMLVIDDVKLEKVEKAVFEQAKLAFDELDEEQKELSPAQYYIYDEDNPDPGDKDDDKEPDKKEGIFDRGDIWLLVSTIIIGAVIIVVVVIMIIRRYKKKHPKKVKGENVVKTEKVIEAASQKPSEKEDIINEDEFVDKKEEEKPKYVQRVLPKKKKKKKKR